MITLLHLLTVAMCFALASVYWGNMSSDLMHNESLLVGILYLLAFVPLAPAVWFISCMVKKHKYRKMLAKNFFWRVALAQSIIMVCLGYLYGFTATPFTSDTHWFSWALIYPVIGLLPLLFILGTAKKCNWTEVH